MNKEMRITDEELAVIKSLFADNESALKMLRKVFLPEITPGAPLGQQVDLWLTIPTEDKSAEEVKTNLLARNLVIRHIENQLIQLRTLAGSKTETVEETKKRLESNSTK